MMRLLLGGAAGSAGHVDWSRPLVQLVFIGVGLVAALLLAVLTSKGPARQRIAEAALWSVALLALGLALAGPVWVEEAGRSEPGRTVVLIDGSASMAVAEGGNARSSAVDGILRALPEDAEIYQFDEDLRAGAPASYTGRSTDLGVALGAMADRHLGQKLRSVVLITDGLDRGGLRADQQAARASGGTWEPPALPGPLTIYQVGSGEVLDDRAIESLESGGFAFLRTPFELRATVRGIPNETLPVSLTREGRLVEEKDVTLDDQGRAEVVFAITPTRVGRYAWEVSVPVGPTDAVPGNNSYPVVVRVMRDRTRILQVSGSPSYDQKFLRLFLKDDPSVDLVSFFILRTHADMTAGWRGTELSLIPFPYEDLFSQDLGSFDLVVLQNFDYAPYFENNATALLENMAAYVRGGGALVMTGGDRSFDVGRYANTAIEAVLPLKLGVIGPSTSEMRFRPALTAAGRNHPVGRLSGTPDESAVTWERLPEMDGMNLSLGPAHDAAVLLEHPSLRLADGQAAPVLAVREVGAGRTMALTVDSSWRWAFSEAANGRGNQAYLRFWKGAVRWLVADPEDRRVVVAPSRENVVLGDEVRVVVRVRDEAYGPVAGAAVQVSVAAPDGSKSEHDLNTDANGEAILPLRPIVAGAHRLTASAGSGANLLAESVVAVSTRDPELAEIRSDTQFLSDLAGAYGERGALRPPGDTSTPLQDAAAARVVEERSELPLDAAPLLVILFGVAASLSWWTRRRAGGR
jgi:uncharacterized membrane protein